MRKKHLFISYIFAVLFFALGCNSRKERTVLVCGGLSDFQCPTAMYCDLGAQCGGVDGQGKCQWLPSDCPIEDAPVCGCDGDNYKNACIANARGVTVLHSGECLAEEKSRTERVKLTYDIPCGGKEKFQCPSNMYCEYGKECGIVDQKGVCRIMPASCDRRDVFRVCGCDGMTYDNRCSAQKNRQSVKKLGPC